MAIRYLDAEYVTLEIGFAGLDPACDPYPDVQEHGRIALEAITVCCVCGMPVNPKTEAEHRASETLGVHLGECWSELKRQAAMPRMRKLLES